MSEDELNIELQEGPASRYAAFVLDVYAAAFDRVPCAEEIAWQCAHLEAGLPPEKLLASVLRSEERQAVVAARAALHARDLAPADRPEHFVDMAYRTILGRKPDAEGLANQSARMADGMSPADFLSLLHDSEEGCARRAKLARPTFDMGGFVRATFEAILHRSPEESAVTFFTNALNETMDLEGFVKGLTSSPEGQKVLGEQGAAPLNAACVSLTLFLEAQLRSRGMVLNLGPPPAANMAAQAAARLLKRLARTIEMLSTTPTAA